MPDLNLPAVLEATDAARMAPHLAPFLGEVERPRVETTRLQPPVCYWAVYEHHHHRATAKCFFDRDDYEGYVSKLRAYFPGETFVFLDNVNGVVWGFPFDPVMPDLGKCFDPEWVAEVMGKPGLALESKLIDYNPEVGAIVA